MILVSPFSKAISLCLSSNSFQDLSLASWKYPPSPVHPWFSSLKASSDLFQLPISILPLKPLPALLCTSMPVRHPQLLPWLATPPCHTSHVAAFMHREVPLFLTSKKWPNSTLGSSLKGPFASTYKNKKVTTKWYH